MRGVFACVSDKEFFNNICISMQIKKDTKHYNNILCVMRLSTINIMIAGEVFTSMCEPDENRRLRKARENPNELANNPRSLVGSRR
jgi:hypothetical protein